MQTCREQMDNTWWKLGKHNALNWQRRTEIGGETTYETRKHKNQQLSNRIGYLQQLNHQQETEKWKLIEEIKEIHNEHEDYETRKHTTNNCPIVSIICSSFQRCMWSDHAQKYYKALWTLGLARCRAPSGVQDILHFLFFLLNFFDQRIQPCQLLKLTARFKAPKGMKMLVFSFLSMILAA